jgi:hypothetical protein
MIVVKGYMQTTKKETGPRKLQAGSNFKYRTLKSMVQERCIALARFNEWEKQIIEKPDSAKCLKAVFELYDLIPDQAKQRPVNVDGIIKMREGLACLT